MKEEFEGLNKDLRETIKTYDSLMEQELYIEAKEYPKLIESIREKVQRSQDKIGNDFKGVMKVFNIFGEHTHYRGIM